MNIKKFNFQKFTLFYLIVLFGCTGIFGIAKEGKADWRCDSVCPAGYLSSCQSFGCDEENGKCVVSETPPHCRYGCLNKGSTANCAFNCLCFKEMDCPGCNPGVNCTATGCAATTTTTTTTTTTVPSSSTGCSKASTTSYDFPTETGSCIDDAGWCGGETIPVTGYGTYADDCDDYCTDNGWVDGGDYSIPNCEDSFVTCGSSCTPDSDYKCCICKCKKATTTTTTTAPGPTTTTAPGPTTTTAPGPTTTTAPSGPVWPVTFSNPINATTFEELIVSIINWLLAIIGSIVLLFIIIGGIMYMTAAGNEEQIKRAKRILFYTILGFAVVLISYSLIQEIKKILGI